MSRMAKKQTSMSNTVLDSLRRDINNGVYKDGQFITESEISALYKVSKTPAREALNALCQEGLLNKIPRKGYMVRKLSLTELKNLYQLRNILERASVEHVVKYASDEDIEDLEKIAHETVDVSDKDWVNKYNELNARFHTSIAKKTGNDFLVDALQRTLNMLRTDMAQDMKAVSLEKSLEAHIHVVEAMKKRDVEEALRVTTKEIVVVESRINLR